MLTFPKDIINHIIKYLPPRTIFNLFLALEMPVEAIKIQDQIYHHEIKKLQHKIKKTEIERNDLRYQFQKNESRLHRIETDTGYKTSWGSNYGIYYKFYSFVI